MPLLERTGRRVTLTPAGAVLVRHAETVLAALERATAALAAARHRTVRPAAHRRVPHRRAHAAAGRRWSRSAANIRGSS